MSPFVIVSSWFHFCHYPLLFLQPVILVRLGYVFNQKNGVPLCSHQIFSSFPLYPFFLLSIILFFKNTLTLERCLFSLILIVCEVWPIYIRPHGHLIKYMAPWLLQVNWTLTGIDLPVLGWWIFGPLIIGKQFWDPRHGNMPIFVICCFVLFIPSFLISDLISWLPILLPFFYMNRGKVFNSLPY